MAAKTNVWLPSPLQDQKISSIFPSYLLRALNITSSYTNDLHQATVVLGGRNLLRVPEHFSGSILGAGVDRAETVRNFPLARVLGVLGTKSAQVVEGPVLGDPLLLADLVHTKLLGGAAEPEKKQQKGGASAKPLMWLQNQAERDLLSPDLLKAPWWIQMGNCTDLVLLDIIGMIGSAKCVLTTDPDILAIALSFQVPCCPITFYSGDLFVFQDLYSVFNQKTPVMVKRVRKETTYDEAISWTQLFRPPPLGQLQSIKAKLQHEIENCFNNNKKQKRGLSVSCFPPKQLPQKKPTTPSPSPTQSLSLTQPIQPVSRTTATASGTQLLKPTWVTSPSPSSSVPPPPPPLPPLDLTTALQTTRSDSSSSSSRVKKGQGQGRGRSRSQSRLLVSHPTPKSS